jgi:hypothetical protein
VSVKLLDQFVENLESTVLGPPAGDPAGDHADLDDETTALLASELTKVWHDKEGREAVRASRPAMAPRPDLLAAEQGLSVATATATATGGTSPSNGSGTRRIDSPEAAPIDLLETAGSPLVKRLLPVLGLALLAAVIVAVLRRRR